MSRQIFNYYDKDHDGALTVDELKSAVRALEYIPSESEFLIIGEKTNFSDFEKFILKLDKINLNNIKNACSIVHDSKVLRKMGDKLGEEEMKKFFGNEEKFDYSVFSKNMYFPIFFF